MINTGKHRDFSLREASKIKAELLKRKLITRKDLMMLYQPPMKRSHHPENNPFTKRTIIERNFNATLIKVSDIENTQVPEISPLTP